MASSDDEAETLPESVSKYYFFNHEDEPISFSVVPCLWSESEKPDRGKETVYLHGKADGELKTIYKEIKAWKFDLSNVKPEISVLSKDNNWCKLESPRKSYEGTVRSVLITVQSLHYLKRNPDASAKTLWDNLAKVFRSYEVRPSPKDLADQTSLITEAIERDDSLGKIKFLTTFLKEKPSKKKLPSEDVREGAKPSFIVEDDADVMEEDINDNSESEDEDEGDVFDSVCAICDNGGELLCCEGRCMRSFHATTRAGEDSLCDSLGYSEKEVEAIENFVCDNCKLKQHQCFVCGKLGSSDKFSGAEVFGCVSATCGRFYHPRCVATLLHSKDEIAAKELQKDIAEGKTFICPSHKCSTCNQGENKTVPELQFAVCRRCPLAYHRKCLPRGIKFEDPENEDEDEDDDEVTRAWEGLLPDRILIYCRNHDIDAELGTPARDHIKFPDVEEKKSLAVERKKGPATESSLSSRQAKMASPALNVSSGRNPSKALGEKRKVASGGKEETLKTKKIKVSSEQESAPRKAVKTADKASQSRRLSSIPVRKSEKPKEQPRVVGMGKTKETTESDQELPGKQDIIPGSKEVQDQSSSSLPSLSAASERRIMNIIKDAKANVTMKDVLKKYKAPCSNSQSLKSYVDKTITMGKLEGAIQAARAALQKLDEGGTIEDAKAVCGPDVLNQIYKWKDKLKVYVSPFIFGPRYTSYGRHFTKVEKLQEIVDRLHWYVEDGDTVVDFCCGANDFSCLMAKKMEETGKKCSYKNYDIFPAKNDFNFEKRDWLTVDPGELPPGNKLVMGLNPPFGVKSALANKFIDKALDFKPKLLILVVPSETQMLDKKKKSQYKLVWEDDRYLSGKSFYLPGSTGENDKHMVEQWNVSPPRIYLWSRQNWLSKHKDIAQKQGHLGFNHQEAATEEDAPILQGGSSSRNDNNNNSNRGKDSQQQQLEPPSTDEEIMMPGTSPKPSMALTVVDDDAGVDYYAAIDGILEELNQQNDDATDNIEEGTSSNHPRHHEQQQQQQKMKNKEADLDEDEKLWRDLDARTSVLLYGRQEPEVPSQRAVYPTTAGHNPIYSSSSSHVRSPTYMRINPRPEPSYQMTSTLQRYRPRLDEMNHQPRTSTVGVGPSNFGGVMGRGGFYEHRVPQQQQLGRYPGSQPPRPPPQGFALGPYRPPFPDSNSSGWLNE